MSRSALTGGFILAADHTDAAVGYLQRLREVYARSRDLEAEVRLARLAALDAKIAALKGVGLDPHAYPWTEDFR